MNRKRCPWCGKRIDKTKDKDKSFWQDTFPGNSLLHRADCSHCGHKYGQFPIFPYLVKIDLLVILLLALTFAFQSGILLVITLFALLTMLFLHLSMPYSKLNDTGKPCEENTDLDCKIVVLEAYGKIKRYELYFLVGCFDDFDPFVLPSPIHLYSVSKKSDVLLGEFLYMHERNDDYINQDSCELYDTEMNMVAKIKFVSDKED